MLVRRLALTATRAPCGRLAAARLAAARPGPARTLCSDSDFMPQRKKFAVDGNVKDQIQKEIEANPVVVFMKGVPSAPMCGFSKQVVEVLKTQGVPFKGINVLADPDVREGVKEFSNWPTVPQLYIGGEFIGGCDITVELHQSGELAEELRKAGVKD